MLERSTNNRKPSGKKYKRLSRVVATGVCTIAILGMIWIISPSLMKNNTSTPVVKPAAPSGDWTPHSQYNTAEGVTKLHVFPGGEYPVGSPAGSWWNLYVPVETLEGQNIRITATHKETGVENQLGFIHPGFQAAQSNKYMWHFWGRDEELNHELKNYSREAELIRDYRCF
ncbi:hypothetical protein MNQ98_06600 [Paenibacillus sp. N3/727]|uniref:hypothetical protein n=1 Tax=Paenibacillus sp. N3/727 TaxID=2925845 RepID=UPI001F533761|nr:hypothetical protein [Paenibacillus sp. N3/727]UNK19695.1 hypothetical protein MNQ98_06600 [Paenibacillus sp. N3/727]